MHFKIHVYSNKEGLVKFQQKRTLTKHQKQLKPKYYDRYHKFKGTTKRMIFHSKVVQKMVIKPK